jgi:endonuclease G
MPTLGPSVLFAAGLTLGVGAGVLFPRKKAEQVQIPPPPPVGIQEVPKRLPTSTGSVALAGGFPGESHAYHELYQLV